MNKLLDVVGCVKHQLFVVFYFSPVFLFLPLKCSFFPKIQCPVVFTSQSIYSPLKESIPFFPIDEIPKKCTLEFLICNPPNFWTSLTKCHTWYVRYKLVISISTKFPSLFPVSVKASCLSTRRSREELEKKKDLHIGLHLLTHHPLSVNLPW